MSPWRRLAEQVVGGRRWVVAIDVLQVAVGMALQLRELGATEVFAIAASVGTGPVDESVPHAVLGVEGDGLMGAIRASG